MNDIMFGLFYLSLIYLIIFVPLLVMDWFFGILYRHCRGFRRRVNRFLRTLPQCK